MKKSLIKDERFWTISLSIAGCFALAWSLFNNPGDWPNILVNFAQIGVVVIVFFIANNIFQSLKVKKASGFNEKFEEHLLEWASLNKYLIDTSEIDKPKGNENKRSIQMICKHADMLKCSDASTVSSKKGSFLYLPKKAELGTKNDADGNKIEFKINKSMFESNKEIFDDYDNRKKGIAHNIEMALKTEFNNPEIAVTSNNDRIIVDFSNMEKNDVNAKKLIDVVEFVKTLFLAVA